MAGWAGTTWRGSLNRPPPVGGAVVSWWKDGERREISRSSTKRAAMDCAAVNGKWACDRCCSAKVGIVLPHRCVRLGLRVGRGGCSKRVEAPGWPVSHIETSRRASEKLPSSDTKSPPPHKLLSLHSTHHSIRSLTSTTVYQTFREHF